jgi:hypothetical protein
MLLSFVLFILVIVPMTPKCYFCRLLGFGRVRTMLIMHLRWVPIYTLVTVGLRIFRLVICRLEQDATNESLAILSML